VILRSEGNGACHLPSLPERVEKKADSVSLGCDANLLPGWSRADQTASVFVVGTISSCHGTGGDADLVPATDVQVNGAMAAINATAAAMRKLADGTVGLAAKGDVTPTTRLRASTPWNATCLSCMNTSTGHGAGGPTATGGAPL
jgi:hypothetical protein